MSRSQLCTFPKTGLSILGRTLFVFPCATDLFFDSFCHCGSQQHGIHYPSGISTLAETEHVIKNSSAFITFLFARIRRAHYHLFHICLWVVQIPPSSHSQLENDWIWGFSCSSGLESGISPDAQRERERFQFMWDSLWWALEERYWASVKHEQQQFIILIAETWNHEWEQC